MNHKTSEHGILTMFDLNVQVKRDFRGDSTGKVSFFSFMARCPPHANLFSVFRSLLTEKGPDEYILVAAQKTWHEARAYCRSRYTDLASVKTQAETNQISSLLTKESWFGLHRKTWAYWSNRTPNTFTNWNQNQPKDRGSTVEACAAVHTTTGKWWDIDCDVENYFICQKVYSRHQQTFKLRFKSRADMTDPALQQQLLQQVQDRAACRSFNFPRDANVA